MTTYRFQNHTFSDRVLDHAAASALDAHALRDSKFGYNYGNMLSILERRKLYGAATAPDLEAAERLYTNIKKMSTARREKIDYSALKNRAETLYHSLQTTKLADTVATELRDMHAMKAAEKRKAQIASESPASIDAIVEQTPTITQTPVVAATPEAPKESIFRKALGYLGRTAAVVALAVGISCGKTQETTTTYSRQAKPAYARKALRQTASVVPYVTPINQQKPYGAAAETVLDSHPQDDPTTTNPIKAEKKTTGGLDKNIPSPFETPRKQETPKQESRLDQNTDSKTSDTNTSLSDEIDFSAIFHVDGRAGTVTSGVSGTAKVMVDYGNWGAGNWGAQAYVNGFTEQQTFDTAKITGSGERVMGGLHITIPLGDNGARAFFEANAGYENRDFKIKPDSGDDSAIGNNGLFVNGKVGVSDGKETDDFGITNRSDYFLLQGTKHFGDASGDIDGSYDAWRLMARGQVMFDPDWSIQFGGSYFDEKFSDVLTQRVAGVEGGVRWHLPDAYLEALLNYQHTTSTFQGSDSTDQRIGVQVGGGYRLISNEKLAADLRGFIGGYLPGSESDGEIYGGIAFDLYFGGKKK